MSEQMKITDNKDSYNKGWRTMESYKGGHALFRIINKNTEFGEFIISGSIDPKYRNVDEIWLNITEYLIDDFGNDLSWYENILFWKPYPKKLKDVE